MKKLTFYGKRVLKIKNLMTNEITYRASGQWVGHAYGSEWGTDRQRRNFYDPETEIILGVSTKVFWQSTIDTKNIKLMESLLLHN